MMSQNKYIFNFSDVLESLLIKNEKIFYQGENFKKGCYLGITECGDITLFEYDNKDSLTPLNCGTPVLSKGLITQKYKQIFTRFELF